MQHISMYGSPLGKIFIAADDGGLIGLWFEGQKYYAAGLDAAPSESSHPVLDGTKRWLDIYFSGKQPGVLPPIHFVGTEFQQAVWTQLLRIPYGKTCTYGAIAAELAKERGQTRMSARAVGSAVGHNKISILVPCHRVLGSDGSLTGYAGGLDRKTALLRLEGVELA